MKNFVSIMAAFIVAGAFAADERIWSFAPEKVDFEYGTTCTKSASGWTLSQPKNRIQFFSKDVFEINPDEQYAVRVKLRGISPKARIWVVSKNYSESGRDFGPTAVDADFAARGHLDAYAHDGATTLKINGAEKWQAAKRRSVLAFDVREDDSDLPNVSYYPVKSIAADGTVELRKPLRRGYSAGTAVRRHFENGPYDTLISAVLTPDFKVFRRNITGVSAKGREFTKWLRCTKKVRIGIQVENGDIELAELFFIKMNK